MNELPPPSDVPPEQPSRPEAGTGSGPAESDAFANQQPGETFITPGGSALEEVVFDKPLSGDIALGGITDRDGRASHRSADIGGGVRFIRMSNGLLRMERTVQIFVRGEVLEETASVVVDKNLDFVDDPEYDDPPQPQPFDFTQPFDETYELPSPADQLEAGRLLNPLHEAVFELYPKNVQRAMGITASNIRRKDVIITAATCDANSGAARLMGRKYLEVATRVPGKIVGPSVRYSLDADATARRWDEIPPGPNAEFRSQLRILRRRDAAERQGPEAIMKFQQEMAAEAATLMDRRLAAETGTNYLPVSPDEVRALGRFVAQKLGLDDDAWQ